MIIVSGTNIAVESVFMDTSVASRSNFIRLAKNANCLAERRAEGRLAP